MQLGRLGQFRISVVGHGAAGHDFGADELQVKHWTLGGQRVALSGNCFCPPSKVVV